MQCFQFIHDQNLNLYTVVKYLKSYSQVQSANSRWRKVKEVETLIKKQGWKKSSKWFINWRWIILIGNDGQSDLQPMFMLWKRPLNDLLTNEPLIVIDEDINNMPKWLLMTFHKKKELLWKMVVVLFILFLFIELLHFEFLKRKPSFIPAFWPTC